MAEKLGYSDKSKLKQLAERHASELAEFGISATVAVLSSRGNGAVVTVYEPTYNPDQAAYLALSSETEQVSRRDGGVTSGVAVALKLSALYRSAVAKEKARKCSEAATERPRDAAGKLGPKPSQVRLNVDRVPQRHGPEPVVRRSDEMAAKALGVSRASLHMLKAVDKKHPELLPFRPSTALDLYGSHLRGFLPPPPWRAFKSSDVPTYFDPEPVSRCSASGCPPALPKISPRQRQLCLPL